MTDLQQLLAQAKQYRGKLLAVEEFLAREDPEGFELFERPALRRGVLDTKTREMIMAALDASIRLRSRHIQRALAAGATKAELIEMLEIVGYICGSATMNSAFEALIEDLSQMESMRSQPAASDPDLG